MRTSAERRSGPPRLVLIVLSGLAVLYGFAAATRPGTAAAPAPAPRKVPVASVTVVCPDPGGSDVGVVTPPGGGGQGAAALVAGERTLATLTVPGGLWQERQKAGSPPIVATASGNMAAGLEAAQTRRETSGEQRGLAGVRCVEPGASAWLVGPGPAAADVTLHLANADLAPAGVEITVYSGEGPVAGGSGDTIMIEPGESRAIRLRDIAPSPLVMAVEVSTAFGRVTAAAHAVMSGGRGVDWLPLSAGPATRVVVPGVPGGGGRRDLLVASPAGTDVIVEVRVVTPDGTYALDGHDAIEVPAGSVAVMDLSAGLDGRPAAVLLTSPVPVVAAVAATGTGRRVDVGFTAGAAPIDLGSVVAGNRTGGKKSSRLVFSAPEAAGRVSVTMLPRKGKAPEPIEVEIPAARTKEVELPDVDGAFAVVAEPLPGSGPVYGARVMDERLSDGRALTVQPLAAARVWALVPPMAESAAAVLP